MILNIMNPAFKHFKMQLTNKVAFQLNRRYNKGQGFNFEKGSFFPMLYLTCSPFHKIKSNIVERKY